MHQVLGDLPFVQIYLDDLIIHSDSVDEHLNQLATVFENLRKSGLKINEKKCQWLQSEIQVLGHVVGHTQVKMDKEKITAVQNFAPPRNLKLLVL